MRNRWGGVLLLAVAVASGCKREADPQPVSPPAVQSPATPAAPRPQAVVLKDVVENTPGYIIGISYPPGAAAYPQPLSAALQQFADAGRAELMEAVQALGGTKPTAPYDMSLSFTEQVNTPTILAIAADGSVYTGGAHGNPLMARFVWLPQQQTLLTASDLIADAAAWKPVSDYVREQLHTALSQRVDADKLEPALRAEVVRSAGKLIDSGTQPGPEDFAQFEPVMGADGRIAALRFVFPPYQVGPYSDGEQRVEVPASLLRPLVAESHRALFED